MYIRKTNNKTHTRYTNEEKEKIVLLYLTYKMGPAQIVRKFDLSDTSTLYRWVKNYKKYGHIIETREEQLSLIILVRDVLKSILKNL